jgi:hypothetical protein
VRRFAIAIVVPALLAGACGDVPAGQEEELTAQAYPRGSDAPGDEPAREALEESAVDTDAGPAPDERAPMPDAAEGGPRPSHAAAYVDEHLPADALDHDVLLLNGPDAEPELVLAVLTADREVNVEAARWTQDAFDRVDRVHAGPAEGLGTLRTRSMGGDKLVVLGFHREKGLRVGLWRLAFGQLEVPGQCPLDQPLRLRGQGSSEVVVGCQGVRGPEEMLVWQEGEFGPREQAQPDREARPEREVRDEPEERDQRPAGEAREATEPREEPDERRDPPERREVAERREAREDRQRPERPNAKEDRRAASETGRPGPPDHVRGQSAATNGPPGTQGRGPGGR